MRIASFNVGCTDLSHFISEITKDEVLGKADVVMLQEIEEYHDRKELQRTLEHFGFYNFFPSRSLKKGEHGIAILSKSPISNYQVQELPAFNLVFRSRSRIAVSGELEANGEKILICNVHLDSRLNVHDRISQIGPLVDSLCDAKAKVILGGDFNTIPVRLYKNLLPIGFADQFTKMEEFLVSKNFKTFHLQPKSSFRSRGVRWLLDFIFVSNMQINDYGVREMIAKSDHHPIWADVE